MVRLLTDIRERGEPVDFGGRGRRPGPNPDAAGLLLPGCQPRTWTWITARTSEVFRAGPGAGVDKGGVADDLGSGPIRPTPS